MVVLYKKAAIEDINTLTEIRIKVLRAANKLPETTDMSRVRAETLRYYKKALLDGTHVACLAYEGGKFAGAGGICFYTVMPTVHNPSGEKAYIMNMYTEPQYRRNGVAYGMLDMLVNEARARGIQAISLEATDMGRPLYEKYGFVQMQKEMDLPEKETKLPEPKPDQMENV